MSENIVSLNNSTGQSPIVLACEHASPHIPKELNSLGLKKEDYLSHAVWDIGALDLAMTMSEILDSPLVSCRLSRLIYDCNRPYEAEDAIPVKSELIEVPGNVGLTTEEKQRRAREIHDVFHRLLDNTLEVQSLRSNSDIVLVTVHSFAPTYYGSDRSVDIGFLHDQNPTMATKLLPIVQSNTGLRVRLNEPYSSDDGVTYTLNKHATKRNIDNVMLEVNNALLQEKESIQTIGDLLCDAITELLPTLKSQHEKQA